MNLDLLKSVFSLFEAIGSVLLIALGFGGVFFRGAISTLLKKWLGSKLMEKKAEIVSDLNLQKQSLLQKLERGIKLDQ